MNAQTTNKTELITWLDSTTNLGKDFLSEQVPLYEQELFKYAITTNVFGLVASLIVSVSCSIFLWKFIKAIKSKSKFLIWDFKGRYYDSSFVAILAVIFVLISTLPFVPYTIYNLFKIKTAPRVYIIEHISGLIGN